MTNAYAAPKGGASLILSFRLQHKATLIVGSGTLAASRAFAALEADSEVIILAKGGHTSACDELQCRACHNQLQIVDWDDLPGSSGPNSYVDSLEAFINTILNLALVVVTDTLSTHSSLDRVAAEQIYRIFKARNIPVNTTDIVDLSDFSFTSSHRFEHPETGEKTPLQLGITTNGHGCRLSGRLRREIITKLPREVGAAVENVGRMRALAKGQTDAPVGSGAVLEDEIREEEEISEENTISTPNRPVPSRSNMETAVETRRRRIKWVAQVSEYWPLSKLASMSEEEMQAVLAEENGLSLNSNTNDINSTKIHSNDDSDTLRAPQSQFQSQDHSAQPLTQPSLHFEHLPIPPSPKPTKPGRILLVGSGPGHPSLLTIATHTALTQYADLVLSDKLVPAAVLDLIPKHVQVRIARKFPGNAEGAQTEMMEAAVEAAKRGMTVVRLKQGDPVVYGRAGEEVLYFRSHGLEPLVIPGVSSALAAPTFAGIPVTQRGVAESFIVCTGVGRKGKEVQLPGYERSRTLIVLMGVARIQQVVDALLFDEEAVNDHMSPSPPDLGSDRVKGGDSPTPAKQQHKRRDGHAYPPHTPIAIIERASMPDQRVIYSTLKDIVRALESSGEQRPPGMMVIGWAVLALSGDGDVGVLDDDNTAANADAGADAGGGDEEAVGGVQERRDRERVARWLGLGGDGNAVGWRVREGIEIGWDSL